MFLLSYIHPVTSASDRCRKRIIVMYTAGSKGRTRVSTTGPGSRPQSKGNQEKNLWSSLLDSVASGKKLPEKQLLVLGQSKRIGESNAG